MNFSVTKIIFKNIRTTLSSRNSSPRIAVFCLCSLSQIWLHSGATYGHINKYGPSWSNCATSGKQTSLNERKRPSLSPCPSSWMYCGDRLAETGVAAVSGQEVAFEMRTRTSEQQGGKGLARCLSHQPIGGLLLEREINFYLVQTTIVQGFFPPLTLGSY